MRDRWRVIMKINGKKHVLAKCFFRRSAEAAAIRARLHLVEFYKTSEVQILVEEAHLTFPGRR